MSVAGLKKQFYKASQMVSEKVGGAEGTKLDEEFKDLERKVDVTNKAVVEVISKTSEYLQPNPASRAKLSMLNTMSKIRGQVKSPGYPQAEGLLGECMAKFGRELGEETNFGGALVDVGESMKRLAEVKDSLDIDVKQNVIDPLQGLCDKDLREIQMGRKLWTSLCGNSLFFFNNTKDNVYIEKLELTDLVSVTDDRCRDRNLEKAQFTLHMKNEDIKMIAPSLESRELWKGFILSVSKLSVPSSLNLLPGQIQMMKETIEKEKKRQQPPTAPSLLHNIYLPVLPDMPACYHDVSRVEAELLLERNANRGNLLLRPGQDGASFAVTTRQFVNGSVFKHYRVSRKHEGGFAIDIDTPISCPTLHDVITCLVEKTNGVLEPFLLEQHYEDNISYVQANEENGERSVQCASSEPLPSRPVPPPKQVQRDYRANSEPLANTQESIYLNEPMQFLPHQNLMLPNQNTSSGSERKALKPPGYPLAALRSSVSDVPENNSQHWPQPAALSEELKMILKKRQAIQE